MSSASRKLGTLNEPEGTLQDAADRVEAWLEDLADRSPAGAMSLQADDLRRLVDAARESTAEQFVRWADRSKAVTWSGKLGLKERWENRDNLEYQAMLHKMGERRNAV